MCLALASSLGARRASLGLTLQGEPVTAPDRGSVGWAWMGAPSGPGRNLS